MKCKSTKIMMLVLIFIVAIVATTVSVFAQENNMPQIEDKTKNLKIEFYIEKSGKTIPIQGAEIGIYRISDLEVQDGSAEYMVLDKYSQLKKLDEGRDVTFNGITVSESNELAQAFADIASEPDFKAVTDEYGECSFSNLDQGMYLVKEESVNLDAEKYEKFDPYLISVPQAEQAAEGNSWIYSVVSEPKSTVVELPTEPVTEPSTEPDTEKPTEKETVAPTQVPTAQEPTLSSKSTDNQTNNIIDSIKTGKVLLIAIPLLVILGLAITLIKLRKKVENNDKV